MVHIFPLPIPFHFSSLLLFLPFPLLSCPFSLSSPFYLILPFNLPPPPSLFSFFCLELEIELEIELERVHGSSGRGAGLIGGGV